MVRYTKMLCIIMLFVCLGLLTQPAVTSAHASLIQSTPAENAVLNEPPTKISLKFNESIQPAFHSIKVKNSSGEQINQGESYTVPGKDSELEVKLEPNLPQGIYTIQWKAVSGDGHPIEGTFAFQLGTQAGNGGSAETTPTSNTTNDMPGVDLIIIRWLLYMSLAMVAGILCFYLYMLPSSTEKEPLLQLPSRSRFLLWSAYGGVVLSLLLSLPQQITIDAGVRWTEVWNAELFSKMLRVTSFGHIWLVQIILMLLLGTMLYAAANMTRKKDVKLVFTLALALSLGMLFCKALIGHPAVTEPKAISIPMDFIHLAAASIWIGALLSIAALLPGEASLPTEPNARKQVYFKVIQRFSYWGTALVSFILISGIYGSLKYIPTWYSLTHTSYGVVLLLKGLLLLIMIGFAAFNMLRGKRGTGTLGASIWIELSAGVITLVLAAVLTNLPPAATSPGPINMEHTLSNKSVISLHISPNQTGDNMFEIQVKDSAGNSVKDIEQIKLTLSSLDMDMGNYDITIPGSSSATSYQAKDLISMAGRWNVSVHVLTSSLEALDTNFIITVGSP
ncbi:copper resistance CopC/CopD family protein [Paenibacillus pini]|uniref:Copper resistance protein CopC n=1 Tax=Paenibacillus pini JCM 16418 TaxID=1236976 RepID=W7YFX1_9BACL|nr:copper resistance protein CopC [Paenibacillus pini]GAF09825.1 hypothetical protein JCM16418_3981 [Paenibacillus pini JCM 16418]